MRSTSRTSRGEQRSSRRDLLGGRLAAELLHQLALDVHHVVELLHHVNGDPDRARLVGDRSRDRLPDPPRRVSGELVTRGGDRTSPPRGSGPATPPGSGPGRSAPGPRYPFAIETTRRRLAFTICSLAPHVATLDPLCEGDLLLGGQQLTPCRSRAGRAAANRGSARPSGRARASCARGLARDRRRRGFAVLASGMSSWLDLARDHLDPVLAELRVQLRSWSADRSNSASRTATSSWVR